MDLKSDLQHYLQTHIPISAAMGVTVRDASFQRIVLSAPFSNNINHKKTVFGGSLHAVATLACWSFLHVNLAGKYKESVELVISKSNVDYIVPVVADFEAECIWPAENDWLRFIKILEKKGKARITLKSKIYQSDKLCVDYSGVFVGICRRSTAQNSNIG